MADTEEEAECEFDGPWKEAIEWFFEPFLQFFFPAVCAAIDWSREYEFLDKELEKIAPDSTTGKGTVDKLAKLWLLDGQERRVFVHVEVQSQVQAEFAERMYTYNHRLRDRHGKMPISVAILGDDRFGWRPAQFDEACCGCEVRFRFPTAKLLDYTGREAELSVDPNPFAAVTMAHLKTLETRGQPGSRQEWKLSLVKGLYTRGYDRERVLLLFRLIDWMMALPPPRRIAFEADIKAYEEEKKVPFISPTEQLWMDRGIETGVEIGVEMGVEIGVVKGARISLLKSIESLLRIRFGADGVALMSQVQATTDADVLLEIEILAIKATDLDSFKQDIATCQSGAIDAVH